MESDCSHEIKRHLLLGRKTRTNLDSILKSRHITLLTKVLIVKAMVFPVVMYESDSWDYKESWTQKNWCFRTVVLEKTLQSPLDCKIKPVNSKGNQSWIIIRWSDAESEAPIHWATWWEECTHLKRPWCWERLKVEGEGDNKGWDGWMASPTQWTWVWVNSRSWWLTRSPGLLQSTGSQRVGHNWETELNFHTTTETQEDGTNKRVDVVFCYPSILTVLLH